MGDAIVIAGPAIEVVDPSVLPRALFTQSAEVKNLSTYAKALQMAGDADKPSETEISPLIEI
jgi:hypothetical protein